jgi:hypothetical protein
MSLPSFVAFDAFWIVLAGLLVALARVLERLRNRHPQIWNELGRPTFLPRTGLASGVALTRFYWSGRATRLDDPVLRQWVHAVRALQMLMAGVLVLLWRLFLANGNL